MNYRNFFVADNFEATSQKPGEGHSVARATPANIDLETILKYQNVAVVHRICKELSVNIEKAKELFTDLKKFLWATSQAKVNVLPPPLIDEAWHAFILFTEDYEIFCNNFFGKMIHHLPHRPGDPVIGKEETKPSIDLFVNLFGSKPSTNWDYINVSS